MQLFSTLISKKLSSFSSEDVLNLSKDLIPLFQCKLPLFGIAREVVRYAGADWLKNIGWWYGVHITFEPRLQYFFLLLVCHVIKKFFKFSGRYFGWKRTKTIFLAQKGLIKTNISISYSRAKGLKKRQSHYDKLYKKR